MQQRNRLGEVHDVDVVTGAEDVGAHFRVPAMRLVTEMRAGFEELTHREIGKCHMLVLRLCLGGS